MPNIRLLQIVLILCVHLVLGSWFKQLFSTSKPIKFEVSQHLATRTPYTGPNSNSKLTPAPKKCEPIFMSLVARHGVRNPTSEVLGYVTKLKQILKDKMGDIKKHEKWLKKFIEKPDLAKWLQGDLVYRGELEHYHLAKRMKKNYPKLFKTKYAPMVYQFQSTIVPRAGTSANAFAFGLLEHEGEVGDSKYQPFFVNVTSEHHDFELRFFKNCPKYQSYYKEEKKNLQKNPDSLYQRTMHEVAKSVSEKLGIHNFTLDVEQTQTIWELCAFRVARKGKAGKWCNLFNKKDLLRVESAMDLADYQLKGYGNKINYEISCPLLNSFVDGMETAIKEGKNRFQKGKFMFAHAETIFPFTSLLGLFNGTWKEEEFAQSLDNNEWRSSRISPFASNIQIVLFQCKSEYRVKVLHNEQEMMVPGCGEMYCPFNKFKKLYERYLGPQCNLKKMCTM